MWRELDSINRLQVLGDDFVTVTRSKPHLGGVLTSDLSPGPAIRARKLATTKTLSAFNKFVCKKSHIDTKDLVVICDSLVVNSYLSGCALWVGLTKSHAAAISAHIIKAYQSATHTRPARCDSGWRCTSREDTMFKAARLDVLDQVRIWRLRLLGSSVSNGTEQLRCALLSAIAHDNGLWSGAIQQDLIGLVNLEVDLKIYRVLGMVMLFGRRG